ncbi:MAG: glycosyltransferase family 39 protein [Robiginitomaculum sp.]|nr:glycosyltransferase family 39 protein [Robiginitomaculum sp.]
MKFAIPKATEKTRHMLIIALLAFLAAAAGVFTMPVLDRDEARFAQAATQMLETGDYVNIRFQDEARNKKPVGIYWAQALSVKVFSDVQAREIWAYRIPSLLAAILAAVATYLAGCYLVGRQAAFTGAALLAVSALFGTEVGIARTDAVLLASTTLMMAVLAALRYGSFRGAALLFWVAMGLSILIKGPLGPALVILTLGALFVWERKANWLRPLLVWWGPLLAIAIVLPWLWAIQQATDGAFLRDALGGDFAAKIAGGKEHHGAPPGYYTLLLVFTIFPASFFLLPGVFKSWQIRQKLQTGSDTKFLIAWAVPFFLVLELVPTKLVHYPLLVYPAIALICGLGLQHLAEFRWLKNISTGLAMLTPLLVVAAIFYLQSDESLGVWESWIVTWIVTWIVVAILVSASIMVVLFAIRNQISFALLLAITAGLSWHISLRTLIVPSLPLVKTSTNISNSLAKRGLHPRFSDLKSSDVMSVNYTEPSLVFALGTDTIMTGDENAFAKYQQYQPSVIVYSLENCLEQSLQANQDHQLGELLNTIKQVDDLCPIAVVPPFRGYNYSRGDCLSVHIFTMRQCK